MQLIEVSTLSKKKLKIGLQGYFTSLLANLFIGQNGLKRQTLKNHDQIEITILSQFKVLMAIFFTKYILQFAND